MEDITTKQSGQQNGPKDVAHLFKYLGVIKSNDEFDYET